MGFKKLHASMQVFVKFVPQYCVGVGSAQLGRVCLRPCGKPVTSCVLTMKNEVLFARSAAAPVCRAAATTKNLGFWEVVARECRAFTPSRAVLTHLKMHELDLVTLEEVLDRGQLPQTAGTGILYSAGDLVAYALTHDA